MPLSWCIYIMRYTYRECLTKGYEVEDEFYIYAVTGLKKCIQLRNKWKFKRPVCNIRVYTKNISSKSKVKLKIITTYHDDKTTLQP